MEQKKSLGFGIMSSRLQKHHCQYGSAPETPRYTQKVGTQKWTGTPIHHYWSEERARRQSTSRDHRVNIAISHYGVIRAIEARFGGVFVIIGGIRIAESEVQLLGNVLFSFTSFLLGPCA